MLCLRTGALRKRVQNTYSQAIGKALRNGYPHQRVCIWANAVTNRSKKHPLWEWFTLTIPAKTSSLGICSLWAAFTALSPLRLGSGRTDQDYQGPDKLWPPFAAMVLSPGEIQYWGNNDVNSVKARPAKATHTCCACLRGRSATC